MEATERRQIASLQSNPGYKALLREVVESNRNRALDTLLSAAGVEEIQQSALELRTWERALRELERYPREMSDALKAEGDFVFGG